MSDKTNKIEKPNVLDKLAKFNDENSTNTEITLGKTGIEVTIPSVISHGEMMKAQKAGRKSKVDAQNCVIAYFCLFDGEKIYPEHVNQFPNEDIMQITNVLYGDKIKDILKDLSGDDDVDG